MLSPSKEGSLAGGGATVTIARVGTEPLRWLGVPLPWLRTLIAVGVICVAVYALAFALPVLVTRLKFDGLLEQMEATTHFLVALRPDMPLYQLIGSENALSQTSTIYNPAYYYILRALPTHWVSDIALLRTLSCVPPLLLSAVLIELVFRTRFKLTFVGLLWAIIYLAQFPIQGWVDQARTECLFVLSAVLVFFTVSLPDDSRGKFVWLGLAIGAAFTVKQPSLAFIGVPTVLAVFDRRYLVSVAVAAAAIGLFLVVMAAVYGNAYFLWTIQVPATTKFSLHDAVWYFRWYVERSPAASVATLVFIGHALMQSRAQTVRTLPLILVCGAVFLIAFIPAGKDGGWHQNFAIFSLVGAIPLAAIVRVAIPSGRRDDVIAALIVGVALVYSLVRSEVEHQRTWDLPATSDIQARAELAEIAAGVAGDFWTTTWPIIDWRAGKALKSPLQQICEGVRKCLATVDPPDAVPPRNEIWARVIGREFDAIAMPSNMRVEGLTAALKTGYVFCFSIRQRYELRNMQGEPIWPSEIWTATQATCDGLRQRFGY